MLDAGKSIGYCLQFDKLDVSKRLKNEYFNIGSSCKVLK